MSEAPRVASERAKKANGPRRPAGGPDGASSFTRRTLHLWAWIASAHGLVIAVTAAALVPWKSPAANVALLAYAALQIATGLCLWRRPRWGWRLGLASGLFGLAAGVLVVTGLLLSWLYLRAVYGAFGYGAAIVSLLFAAAGFQLLGLLPALQLRALLRREVRADYGPARAARGGIALLLLVPVLAATAAYLPFRLRPVAALSPAARQQSVAVLRAALSGAARPAAPALVGVPTGPGPLFVTLWDRGKAVARVTGSGADLAAAVEAATQALLAHPGIARHGGRGRLKLDRVVAVGPIASERRPVLALSVVPGADGLRRRDGPPERALLPDDMVLQSRFGAAPILPGLREVRLGLDAGWALERLGQGGGPIERLGLESWVEPAKADGQPRAVVLGNTPLEPAGPEGLVQAAVEAGRCMVRQLHEDGRFNYEVAALRNRRFGKSDASLPRHAGAIYGLSQLYAHTKEGRFRRAARRAANWLVRHRVHRCGEHRCVAKSQRAKLGASALTLIALLEYQHATGSPRFAGAADELRAFLLAMQRPGGDFHHVYDRRRGAPDPTPTQMFASEQAALALVMAHEVLGDEPSLPAAERALDWLTGPKYGYFLGRFSYGADHWTCLAAERAWPRLRSERYLDFCKGYSAFIGRLQFDQSHPAFAGHYGFSAVMVPQAPATAGFTEAVAATYLLSRHHGEPDEGLRQQTLRAAEALRRDQLRPDNSYLARNPQKARGGIRRSLVEQDIRIDFLQHSISALLGGAAAAS